MSVKKNPRIGAKIFGEAMLIMPAVAVTTWVLGPDVMDVGARVTAAVPQIPIGATAMNGLIAAGVGVVSGLLLGGAVMGGTAAGLFRRYRKDK